MTVGGIPLVAFLTAMLAAGLVAAAPLVLAALGEAVGERRAAQPRHRGDDALRCFFGFTRPIRLAAPSGACSPGLPPGSCSGRSSPC